MIWNLELLEEHAEPILEAFYDLVDLTDFAGAILLSDFLGC